MKLYLKYFMPMANNFYECGQKFSTDNNIPWQIKTFMIHNTTSAINKWSSHLQIDTEKNTQVIKNCYLVPGNNSWLPEYLVGN
jgi:hypothetical protein